MMQQVNIQVEKSGPGKSQRAFDGSRRRKIAIVDYLKLIRETGVDVNQRSV